MISPFRRDRRRFQKTTRRATQHGRRLRLEALEDRLLMATSGPSSFGTPFSGTPAAVPGLIQAEDFNNGVDGVAYHDSDTTNSGNAYRSTGVDIEGTLDTGGGYDVGWIVAGEWLAYTVNVPTAGTYTLGARVASSGPGGTFHVEFNGVNSTGSLSIPNTGSWQNDQTINATVQLNAGVQVMRIAFDTNGATGYVGNLNWVQLTPLMAAQAGGPYTGNEGSPISLAATASGGSGTYSYAWDLDNNGSFETPGKSVSLTEPDNGTYTVGLRATDSSGLSAQTTATIVVSNVVPTALTGGPYTTTTGRSLTLQGSATDPSSVDTAAGFTYAWNFGDGTVASGLNLSSPSHTYTTAGNYTVALTATDKDGGAGSATTTTTVTAAKGTAPQASFVKSDATTTGNWAGVYGAEGYNVIGGTSNLPAYATVSASGQAFYTWAATTSDPRAPVTSAATGANRVAATWYTPSTSFTIDINLTDGQTHQIALYAVDWDSNARSERIDVVNPTTGAILNSQTLSGFTGGDYLVWNLTGHVQLKVTRLAGVNAVVSGLFFGGASGTTGSKLPLSGSAGGPYIDPEGSTITLSAMAAGGTSPYTYAWDLNNDGTFETSGQNVAFTPADNGTYTTGMQVTDSAGHSTQSTTTIAVTNVAPKALMGGPYAAIAGTPFTVHGSATDPSSVDTAAGFTYTWNFGDGTPPVNGLGVTAPSHTYSSPGTDTITLTVKDKDGGTGQANATVIVAANPLSAGPDQSVSEGSTVSFAGQGVGVTGWTYAWNFGDGGTASGTLSPQHVYQDNGTYTATLTATASLGATLTSSAKITVANVAPTAILVGVPATSPAGTTITLSGSATDPGAADMAAGFTYAWAVTKNGGAFASGTGSTFGFTPDDQATFGVSVTATDKDGAHSAPVAATINVTDVAPTVTVSGPYAGLIGQTITIQGAATNPAAAVLAAGFTYTWNFGDGATTSGWSLTSPTHFYGAAGSYTVQLTATDKNGGTSAVATSTVTVTGLTQIVPSATPSMTLEDFDGPTLPQNGAGDTYPSEYGPASYQGGGSGSLSIETTDGVEGNSAAVTVTAGNFYAQFNPYNADGTRGFASDYSANPAAWQDNTYDRMSFWIKRPTTASPLAAGGNFNVELGTYVKQITNEDPTSDEAGGDHYYTLLNLPNDGQWTQVIINMHMSHWRSQPGSDDPGIVAYPTTSAFGGDDPANTYNFFDTLTRFYLQDYSAPSSYPSTFLIDDIQFSKAPYQENDQEVYGLSGNYDSTSNNLSVTWSRDKNDNTVNQDVRYSFTDIHQTGWDAATPAPSGILTPPGWQGYNGMVYQTGALPLAGHTMVYIAIKPEDSNLFSEIAIPLNLDGTPTSAPVPIATALATATYMGTDTTTQGNWVGTYGSDGYDVIGGQASLPSYATVTPAGESTYTWAANTTDPRAPLVAVSSPRVAATWYNSAPFSIYVDLADGEAHQVSLYALDWENAGRSERIDVLNADSGQLLDSETLSSFGGGKYLTWSLSGSVEFKITPLGGPNAVISGLFFGVSQTKAHTVSATATYEGSDTTTQGNWVGTYGSSGYDVIGGQASLPVYVALAPLGNSTYTWTSSTTDQRAPLASATSTARVAATWYSATPFAIDLSLSDGQTHQVSIYAMDWDNQARSERIDVLDAASGQLLDSETLSSFGGGTYLTWALSGSVVIEITPLSGRNAVISGLFLGKSS